MLAPEDTMMIKTEKVPALGDLPFNRETDNKETTHYRL